MRLLVVSDLHITGSDDPIYHSLLKLLRERARFGDTLVLAGDLFDLFVGDKKVFTERYAEFFSALRAAGDRGVKLHYIEGNHDFLLKRAFAGISQFSMHTEEVPLSIGGRRFFVAHGDLVDRGDYGYRALRAFFRSPVLKAFVKLAPDKWIDSIGRKSSDTSRKRKPLLPGELPIERREKLRKVYRSYAAEKLAEGYDYVVLGHCHDLDEMKFQIGGRTGQYVNVGYPRIHGSYLEWESGEEFISRVRLP